MHHSRCLDGDACGDAGAAVRRAMYCGVALLLMAAIVLVWWLKWGLFGSGGSGGGAHDGG